MSRERDGRQDTFDGGVGDFAHGQEAAASFASIAGVFCYWKVGGRLKSGVTVTIQKKMSKWLKVGVGGGASRRGLGVRART